METEKKIGRPRKYETTEEKVEACRKSTNKSAKKNYEKNKEDYKFIKGLKLK